MVKYEFFNVTILDRDEYLTNRPPVFT